MEAQRPGRSRAVPRPRPRMPMRIGGVWGVGTIVWGFALKPSALRYDVTYLDQVDDDDDDDIYTRKPSAKKH
jgi:hypothetical protein